MPPYSLQDVVASYRWLGHRGFTELNAFHRDYRPGPENNDWNLKHNLFPVVAYTRSEQGVAGFVRKYHPYRMLCYGINPRPRVYQNRARRPRSAREAEIATVQNLVFDIDVASKQPSQAQIVALGDFLKQADGYFLDQNFNAPVKAYTGRGYHLLCAFPEILVSDYPDIALRLKQFAREFKNAYRHELAALDARLDSTYDLARRLRVYGSAKPLVGIVSKFYGTERSEDERLAAYLLGLRPQQNAPGVERNFSLRPAGEIPQWFTKLLEADSRISQMWAGTGKAAGDTSRSGYDYSLVSRLLHLGYRNLDDLATILILRPEGSVQKSGKDQGYVCRTISKAIG